MLLQKRLRLFCYIFVKAVKKEAFKILEHNGVKVAQSLNEGWNPEPQKSIQQL